MGTTYLDVVGIQCWRQDFGGVAPTISSVNGVVTGDVAVDTSNDSVWRCRNATVPTWVVEGVKTAADITYVPSGVLTSTDVQDAIDELEDEKATRIASPTENDILSCNANGDPQTTGKQVGNITPDAYTTKTISAGVLAITQTCHSVDGEGALPDNLDSISGGQDGMLLFLRPESSVHTITIKDSVGNIYTPDGEDYVIPDTGFVILQMDGANWFMVAQPMPGLDFTGLGDTPVSYTGESLKGVRVNSGETALEFFDSVNRTEQTISTNTVLTVYNGIKTLYVDTSGGSVDATLHTATGWTGVLRIVKVDASNTVTIKGVVNGVTDPTLTGQWEAMEIRAYNGSFYVPDYLLP